MPGGDERVDHRLVGIALLALGGDHPPPLEAGRGGSEDAVVIDREGDGRVDPLLLERARILGPQVEVLPAMAWCGVDEAGAGLVGDVIAGKQRDLEIVAASFARGCSKRSEDNAFGWTDPSFWKPSTRAALNISSASASAKTSRSPACGPVAVPAAVTS